MPRFVYYLSRVIMSTKKNKQLFYLGTLSIIMEYKVDMGMLEFTLIT